MSPQSENPTTPDADPLAMYTFGGGSAGAATGSATTGPAMSASMAVATPRTTTIRLINATSLSCSPPSLFGLRPFAYRIQNIGGRYLGVNLKGLTAYLIRCFSVLSLRFKH